MGDKTQERESSSGWGAQEEWEAEEIIILRECGLAFTVDDEERTPKRQRKTREETVVYCVKLLPHLPLSLFPFLDRFCCQLAAL